MVVRPRWLGAFAFWLGSDHYPLEHALKRAPFALPLPQVVKVYQIEYRPLVGIGGNHRFAIEYFSGQRDCLITLEDLPPELLDQPRTSISSLGMMRMFLRLCLREPTAFALPLLFPLSIALFLSLFGLWNAWVLHNPDVLALFSRPGCDPTCVRKVLSIHSLVGLLFFVQLFLLFVPFALLFVQAPRYRSALNYRMMQTYSAAAVMLGLFTFFQLVATFPFKQYGKILGLGFDLKVERLLPKPAPLPVDKKQILK